MDKKPGSEANTTNRKQARCNVESTVGKFASRIHRQLERKSLEEEQLDQIMQLRKNIALEAMTSIRKALQDTVRLKLGERFSLKLLNDDWEGWPRVQLILMDSLAPSQITHALVVKLRHREDVTAIEMSLKSGDPLGVIQIVDGSEVGKLSAMFKKVVRDFLDLAACSVLNPANPEEIIDFQSRPVEDGGNLDLVEVKLRTVDVFAEEIKRADSNRIISNVLANPIDDPMARQLQEEEEKQERKTVICSS